MKRYAVSYARFVNENSAKDGVKFQYSDRTDDPEKVIESYKSNNHCVGLQIKDSVTKKVIFSDVRKVRGALLVTYKSAYGSIYTVKNRYVNFEDMRREEKDFTSRINKESLYATIIKVEREIYG